VPKSKWAGYQAHRRKRVTVFRRELRAGTGGA